MMSQSFLLAKNSSFKWNMFRINLGLIVVGLRVEGENNKAYMRRWKDEHKIDLVHCLKT